MQKGIDYVGITVCCWCHDGNGNVLLNKRSINARDEHDRWDICGGALEVGLTIEENIRKEIKEEYSTDALKIEPLGYHEIHREHNGKKTHWIGLDFKVLIDRAKAKNGEPHKFDELAWFSKDNLPSPLHSQFPRFLEKYKDKLWQ